VGCWRSFSTFSIATIHVPAFAGYAAASAGSPDRDAGFRIACVSSALVDVNREAPGATQTQQVATDATARSCSAGRGAREPPQLFLPSRAAGLNSWLIACCNCRRNRLVIYAHY
jgi:hypothetical protein